MWPSAVSSPANPEGGSIYIYIRNEVFIFIIFNIDVSILSVYVNRLY